MTRLRSTRAAACLALGGAVLVAACSGSTSSGAPSVEPTAITSAAPSVAAETTAPTAAASGGLVLPSLPIAIPSFDIGTLTAGLANVNSYKVAITLGTDQSLSGTVVTKPVLARDYTLKDGTHIIVIGDKAWIGKGSATPQAVPGAMASALFSMFDPTLLVGAFSGPAVAAAATNQGTETKNGVQATHYHVDSTTGAGASGIPSGASLDLWIADKGYLVALEAKGFPQGDFSIQVTEVDDPANQVVAPS
jgi:hypothetical protein